MRFNTERATKFYTYLNGVRLTGSIISEKDMKRFFKTINAINGVDKDKGFLEDYMLDKYQIPAELKSLIVPCSVKYATGVGYNELRSDKYKTNLISDEGITIMTPDEFEIAGRSILGAIKKVPSNMESVMDLRKEKILSNVDKTVAYDEVEKVEPYATAYIPVLINISLINETFTVMSINDMADQYLKDIISTLLSKGKSQ